VERAVDLSVMATEARYFGITRVAARKRCR